MLWLDRKRFLALVSGCLTRRLLRSILLLPHSTPQPPPEPASTVGQAAKGSARGSATNGKAKPVSSASNSSSSNQSTLSPPFVLSFDRTDVQSWTQIEHLLSTAAASGLDWNNCCIFNVTRDKGAALQQKPFWPLVCTAGYHAAKVKGEAVATGDYTRYNYMQKLSVWFAPRACVRHRLATCQQHHQS